MDETVSLCTTPDDRTKRGIQKMAWRKNPNSDLLRVANWITDAGIPDPQQTRLSILHPVVKQSAHLIVLIHRLVQLHNQARSQANLLPLVHNTKLDRVAIHQAQINASANALAHIKSIDMIQTSLGRGSLCCGEHVAYYTRRHSTEEDLSEVFETWMRSDSFRSKILNSRFEQIGVGFAQGSLERVHVCVIFVYSLDGRIIE